MTRLDLDLDLDQSPTQPTKEKTMLSGILTRKFLLAVATAGALASASVGGTLALSSTGPATPVSGPETLVPGPKPCATEIAAAAASATVDTVRAVGDCEIARRMATLDKLTAAVAGAKAVTASDAAALNAEIASTRSGLTALKSTIDAETSLAALRAEIKQIATDYRVYLLLVPKVHLVVAADREVASRQVFDRVSAKLQTAIDKARAAGKDVTAAQADLDKMNGEVDQAVALATPLPAQLLPLTPAQYNAGTAGPILKSARTAVVQARDLLKQAKADAEAARDALQALAV